MKKHLFILFFSFLSVSAFSQLWQQIADFAGTERDDPAAFVIGAKAYCGSGQIPWFISRNDFYSFDMATEAWDTIAALPAGGRQYASAFSWGNEGFLFGGYDNSTYFSDLWKYDPLANAWTAASPIPAAGRMGCASFVINGVAYLVGGRTTTNISINEVWAYDITNDSWQRKADLPFGARWRSAAAMQNNKGYLALGRDENNHFCKELYEYDPIADAWTLISVFPGAGRTYASMLSFSNNLLIIAGLDSLGANYNDMWRISPDTLSWQQLNSIPSVERRGGAGFSSSTAVYYTTGVTQSGTRLKETWKVTNPLSVAEISKKESINCYPNPADGHCFITIPNAGKHTELEIIDQSGRLLKTVHLEENTTQVETAALANGLYLLRIRAGSTVYYSRVAVLH
ncbi:MAG: C-terminal target protein [Bacteroidetes bacterium]|nr:C-terminal target protein [Bacteroidota bacterium]